MEAQPAIRSQAGNSRACVAEHRLPVGAARCACWTAGGAVQSVAHSGEGDLQRVVQVCAPRSLPEGWSLTDTRRRRWLNAGALWDDSSPQFSATATLLPFWAFEAEVSVRYRGALPVCVTRSACSPLVRGQAWWASVATRLLCAGWQCRSGGARRSCFLARPRAWCTQASNIAATLWPPQLSGHTRRAQPR